MTNYYNIDYKIISTNKFVINKIKFKLVLKLKESLKNEEIKDENNIYKNVIQKICKKKGMGMESISFTKLMLLYNKIMNK